MICEHTDCAKFRQEKCDGVACFLIGHVPNKSWLPMTLVGHELQGLNKDTFSILAGTVDIADQGCAHQTIVREIKEELQIELVGQQTCIYFIGRANVARPDKHPGLFLVYCDLDIGSPKFCDTINHRINHTMLSAARCIGQNEIGNVALISLLTLQRHCSSKVASIRHLPISDFLHSCIGQILLEFQQNPLLAFIPPSTLVRQDLVENIATILAYCRLFNNGEHFCIFSQWSVDEHARLAVASAKLLLHALTHLHGQLSLGNNPKLSLSIQEAASVLDKYIIGQEEKNQGIVTIHRIFLYLRVCVGILFAVL
jgi:hypothetical protein